MAIDHRDPAVASAKILEIDNLGVSHHAPHPRGWDFGNQPSAFAVAPLEVLLRFLLWWGQLVTSPLWARELSFEHLLEIARTHTDSTSKLSTQNVSLGSAFPSLPCLPYRTACL